MRPATRKSGRVDRRQARRSPANSPALVGRRDMGKNHFENGVVEDAGRNGVRIRSGLSLNTDETVLIYIGDKPQPVRAKVVWSRSGGLIEKRASGRLGNACVAGCRVLAPEAPKDAKKRPAAAKSMTWTIVPILMKVVFYGGVLAVIGALVYVLGSVFSMMA